MDSFKDILEYVSTKSNQLNELGYIQIMEWRSWIIPLPFLKANL